MTVTTRAQKQWPFQPCGPQVLDESLRWGEAQLLSTCSCQDPEVLSYPVEDKHPAFILFPLFFFLSYHYHLFLKYSFGFRNLKELPYPITAEDKLLSLHIKHPDRWMALYIS